MDMETRKCSVIESVYRDITDFDLGTEVEKLKDENKQLLDHIESLEVDIEKLTDALKRLKTIQESLANNISSLFLTAKAEIERKDRVIAELRSELDNVIFRRKDNKRKEWGRSSPDCPKRGRYELPNETYNNENAVGIGDRLRNDPNDDKRETGKCLRDESLERMNNHVDRNKDRFKNKYNRKPETEHERYNSENYRRNVDDRFMGRNRREARHGSSDRCNSTEGNGNSYKQRRSERANRRTDDYDERWIEKSTRNFNTEKTNSPLNDEVETLNESPRTISKSSKDDSIESKLDNKKPARKKLKASQEAEKNIRDSRCPKEDSSVNKSESTGKRSNYFIEHMANIMDNVIQDINKSKLISLPDTKKKFERTRQTNIYDDISVDENFSSSFNSQEDEQVRNNSKEESTLLPFECLPHTSTEEISQEKKKRRRKNSANSQDKTVDQLGDGEEKLCLPPDKRYLETAAEAFERCLIERSLNSSTETAQNDTSEFRKDTASSHKSEVRECPKKFNEEIHDLPAKNSINTLPKNIHILSNILVTTASSTSVDEDFESPDKKPHEAEEELTKDINFETDRGKEEEEAIERGTAETEESHNHGAEKVGKTSDKCKTKPESLKMLSDCSRPTKREAPLARVSGSGEKHTEDIVNQQVKNEKLYDRTTDKCKTKSESLERLSDCSRPIQKDALLARVSESGEKHTEDIVNQQVKNEKLYDRTSDQCKTNSESLERLTVCSRPKQSEIPPARVIEREEKHTDNIEDQQVQNEILYDKTSDKCKTKSESLERLSDCSRPTQRETLLARVNESREKHTEDIVDQQVKNKKLYDMKTKPVDANMDGDLEINVKSGTDKIVASAFKRRKKLNPVPKLDPHYKIPKLDKAKEKNCEEPEAPRSIVLQSTEPHQQTVDEGRYMDGYRKNENSRNRAKSVPRVFHRRDFEEDRIRSKSRDRYWSRNCHETSRSISGERPWRSNCERGRSRSRERNRDNYYAETRVEPDRHSRRRHISESRSSWENQRRRYSRRKSFSGEQLPSEQESRILWDSPISRTHYVDLRSGESEVITIVSEVNKDPRLMRTRGIYSEINVDNCDGIKDDVVLELVRKEGGDVDSRVKEVEQKYEPPQETLSDLAQFRPKTVGNGTEINLETLSSLPPKSVVADSASLLQEHVAPTALDKVSFQEPVAKKIIPPATPEAESSPNSSQAPIRKRITPIRVPNTPVCTFENILVKNSLPSFKKELNAPDVSPLTLTHEGEIPLLHLEENHFSNLNDEGTHRSFDKNILNLLHSMNVSNLDCDMIKFPADKEEVARDAEEDGLNFHNVTTAPVPLATATTPSVEAPLVTSTATTNVCSSASEVRTPVNSRQDSLMTKRRRRVRLVVIN